MKTSQKRAESKKVTFRDPIADTHVFESYISKMKSSRDMEPEDDSGKLQNVLSTLQYAALFPYSQVFLFRTQKDVMTKKCME